MRMHDPVCRIFRCPFEGACPQNFQYCILSQPHVRFTFFLLLAHPLPSNTAPHWCLPRGTKYLLLGRNSSSYSISLVIVSLPRSLPPSLPPSLTSSPTLSSPPSIPQQQQRALTPLHLRPPSAIAGRQGDIQAQESRICGAPVCPPGCFRGRQRPSGGCVRRRAVDHAPVLCSGTVS